MALKLKDLEQPLSLPVVGQAAAEQVRSLMAQAHFAQLPLNM
jgi:hypothetical protein